MICDKKISYNFKQFTLEKKIKYDIRVTLHKTSIGNIYFTMHTRVTNHPVVYTGMYQF